MPPRQRPLTRDEGLHQRFARIAMARPDAVALVEGDAPMTYRELDRTANAWAAGLVAAGVGPRHCVPIALPRGMPLVVALLATLKAGAAYALLDPDWPADRLTEVVSQLPTPLLVGPPGLAGAVPAWAPPVGAMVAPPDFRPAAVDGGHPCCAFFTSGTTGQPKGVLTQHRATARLFRPPGFAHFDATTVMPLAAPSAWDAFSLELWAPLLHGGTSVIVTEPYLSGESLRRVVARSGVTVAWLTTSLFNMVVDEDVAAFAGLGQLLIGGERLSPRHVRRFLRHHPGIALINGYGPVESTVFATTHRITPADCDRPDGIPLGRPVPGTRVLVLDGAEVCVPGEEGEICIAGDGLALGYLGDDELTAAKFPTGNVDGAPVRLYRTGDMGWWEADGMLQFRGRADRQLKIRGHRIEPSDVEHQIERRLPAVKACRVLARRDGEGVPYALVAFCVPRRPGDALADALTQLRSALLPHQRPVTVVSVDAFPLTAQGKLDERALLTLVPPTTTGDARGADPATDPITAQVGQTFAEVLGRSVVALDVPFFELGGSSLDAGRVCARLAARLARPVPVSWLFADPTAHGLGHRLRGTRIATTDVDVSQDAVSLTPMQLVFLTRHLVDPADRTGHCLLVWSVEGELDRAALASAVAAVHQRHEPLRAAYVPDPRPGAVLVEIAPPPLELLADQPSVEAAVRAVRHELSQQLAPMEGEVWRSVLAPVAPMARGVFGCAVHHIAFDGWSESVLARDLATAYNLAAGTATVPPDPPPPSLRVVSAQRLAQLAQVDLATQRAQLLAELTGVPELQWPPQTDGPAAGRPVEAGQAGGPPRHIETLLDAALIDAVDALATAAGVTRFVVLLACWGAAVAAVTGQHDFAVGVPVAQRAGIGLERSVGCHLTMVCIRLRDAALPARPGDPPSPDGVRATGRAVARAFATQDIGYPELVKLVSPVRTGRPPLFQTLFALQDNLPPRLDLAGVRTRFLRQSYLDLPAELHGEAWPDESGGLCLVSSYRPHAVPDSVADRCARHFVDGLAALRSGRRT